MLGGGQGLDEGPEVLEGDALAVTDPHLTQDLAEALVRSKGLGTQDTSRDTLSRQQALKQMFSGVLLPPGITLPRVGR